MKLILIRGLPGSGKSTLAKLIMSGISHTDHRINARHAEADDYFINDETDEYQFNPEFIKEAHQHCQSRAWHGLRRGDDVIVSNTFVKQWEIQPYLDMAKEFGATVQLIECKSNFGSIHGVPEATIEKMRVGWEEIKL